MLRGMSSAHVASVNLGAARPTDTNSAGRTGIAKHPVGSVDVRAPGSRHGGLGSGIVGDFIGDRPDHGGDHQAVYAVAREELDAWAVELDRDLPAGSFGENLTTQDLAVDAAIVGQTWQIGEEVVLRVSGPRIPCRTFAEHMGMPAWVKRFAQRGRSGAYLSVQEPGTIRPGDPITVLHTPDHGVDVSMTFRAFMGDLETAQIVLDAGCLDPEADAKLREKVRKRQRADQAQNRGEQVTATDA